MEFEYDPVKADTNLQKHGVSFKEAATVFADPLSFTFNDRDHSQSEPRYVTMGISERGRVIVVMHTTRRNRIRIISARRPTKQERKYYEEER